MIRSWFWNYKVFVLSMSLCISALLCACGGGTHGTRFERNIKFEVSEDLVNIERLTISNSQEEIFEAERTGQNTFRAVVSDPEKVGVYLVMLNSLAAVLEVDSDQTDLLVTISLDENGGLQLEVLNSNRISIEKANTDPVSTNQESEGTLVKNSKRDDRDYSDDNHKNQKDTGGETVFIVPTMDGNNEEEGIPDYIGDFSSGAVFEGGAETTGVDIRNKAGDPGTLAGGSNSPANGGIGGDLPGGGNPGSGEGLAGGAGGNGANGVGA